MKTKIFFLSLIAIAITSFYSCQDFSEEDALKAQQLIDLLIVVDSDIKQDRPLVEGAEVTITQFGETRTQVTDEFGTAAFPGAKVGSFSYKVKKDGYYAFSGTSQNSVTNIRQSQMTTRVTLSPILGETFATLRGHVIIESDLTNSEPEPAEGAKVDLIYSRASGTQVSTATVDANGDYSIDIPVSETEPLYVSVFFGAVELDQKIAIRKFSNEIGSLTDPTNTVFPRVESITTLFQMSAATLLNNNVPTNVPSVYGVAPNPQGNISDDRKAIISGVSVNSKGEVIGLSFSDGGKYEGDLDKKVTVSIVSLVGGTGASVEFDLTNHSSLSAAYGAGDYTLIKGSGYPNYTLNRTGTRYASGNTGLYVSAGQVYVINGDYGSGVFRSDKIE